MKTYFTLLVVVLTALLWNASASAIPLTGSITDFFHSYTFNLSSVQVDLGSGPQSTGPLTIVLDLTHPSAQTITINFDKATVSLEADFLVTSPLLQSINVPPVPIHISESGPIVGGTPDLPEGPGVLSIEALLTGGGTILTGPFTGFSFSNFNDTIIVKDQTNNSGTINQDTKGGGEVRAQLTGTVNSPGGSSSTTSGTGTGKIGSTPAAPVPEPSTFLLVVLGLASLAFAVDKNRKSQRKKGTSR